VKVKILERSMGALTPFPQSKTIEEENGRILREVGRFLKAHALRPTPEYYRLAYALVVTPESPLARAIAAATLDGVRLLQSEADRLLDDAGIAPHPGTKECAEADLLRQQMEEFARTIEKVRVETESYGRDLESGAAQIERVDDALSKASILAITGQMLARTRLAEQKLANAEREASALRQRLAAAEEDARTDKVTGLVNRRGFDDRCQAFEQDGKLVSVAICDVDCFKQVNDTHGHAVGDRVLRVIADTLVQFCASHLVARFGGEEFVILFEGLNAAEAQRCLERARLDLERRVLHDRDSGALIGTITFSAGIAEGRAGIAALIGEADELLYSAKKKGRNRICIR
jgi:diguanylate cyclase